MFGLGKISTAAVIAGSFVAPAMGFWRLPCTNPVLVERADPIVTPGQVSGHLHTIMGANNFNFTTSYAQARKATCSTCTVKQDMSTYWTPSLFFQAKNGSFTPVKQVGGATIYYLQRKEPGEKLLAFPPDFRMIAGNPNARSDKKTLESQAVSFACLGGPPSAETNGFPTRNCPNGLRMQVFFPSCWNGKDVDSPNHKSHMAYPSRYNSGPCPASHPKRFISLFYEVMFSVDDFKNDWTDGKWPFVLSNGDSTGYGFHGDFLNGWDVPTLQKAVDECNDNSGDVKKCGAFEFVTDREAQDCMLMPAIKEQTTGWLKALPGCNPVSGPSTTDYVPKPCTGVPTTFGERQSLHTDVSSLGYKYTGCAEDPLDRRTLEVRNWANDMTVPKCVELCKAKNFRYAGLEYGNECWCGNKLDQSRLGSMRCTMPCAGDSSQFCGNGQKLSVYERA